jgi:hypothetical protein
MGAEMEKANKHLEARTGRREIWDSDQAVTPGLHLVMTRKQLRGVTKSCSSHTAGYC